MFGSIRIQLKYKHLNGVIPKFMDPPPHGAEHAFDSYRRGRVLLFLIEGRAFADEVADGESISMGIGKWLWSGKGSKVESPLHRERVEK